jgi:hypothetical protein
VQVLLTKNERKKNNEKSEWQYFVIIHSIKSAQIDSNGTKNHENKTHAGK